MAVQQPPITGDPQQDSFNQQVADAINTMPIGNVINTDTIITTGTAGEQGLAGRDGLNRASIFLYQRTPLLRDDNQKIIPPLPISDSFPFRFNYQNNTLFTQDSTNAYTVGPPWEGWYDHIPPRTSALRDDYIWFQTINVSDRTNFEDIVGSQFSGVGLTTRPGLGALRVLTSYEELADVDENSFKVTINKIFLGEEDVTSVIPTGSMGQICFLIANDDGEIPIADGQSLAQFLEVISSGSPTAAQTQFFNRNFNTDGSMPVLKHEADINRSTTFLATELFNSNEVPEGGVDSDLAFISREIEPRILIDNVVNI